MFATFLNLARNPFRRPFLWSLLGVNAAGSLYGFYWYHDQLAATPLYLWLFVPDCPLYTTIFCFVLAGLITGVVSPLLQLVTYVGLIKYGAWAVFVLTLSGVTGSGLDREGLLLYISHVGMVLEGALFLLHLAWTPAQVWWNAGWMATNDAVDYLIGTYPTLPEPAYLKVIITFTISSTILITAFLFKRASSHPVRHKIK